MGKLKHDTSAKRAARIIEKAVTAPGDPDFQRITRFSEDRRYRYTLWRFWANQVGTSRCDVRTPQRGVPTTGGAEPPFIQFIGLNPSVADETRNDRTLNRCIAFAKAWGFGALCMTNLFAWIETDSNLLSYVKEPVGVLNDFYLEETAGYADQVIACWGNGGAFRDRDEKVKRIFADLGVPLHCLRLTGQGQPEHPLYLPKDLKPTLWNP